VRYGLWPQEGVRRFATETRGVEHNHEFSYEGFSVGLAGFFGNEACDFGFAFVQEALELPQNTDAALNAEFPPRELRRAGAGDGRLHFFRRGAIELAQNLARRGIERREAAGFNGKNGEHQRKFSRTDCLLIFHIHQEQPAG